ncbi:hypothetical protein F2P81_007429 [Scophthalmus maximus]|uniref:Uncharacterized protein n=1 Tax=Scophthalmus maximus TaxID=52904 RepID=A0A6A4TF99_SCOMX|nr:hypothetical protein F2P81_007429 [Scophthalmus maximus]
MSFNAAVEPKERRSTSGAFCNSNAAASAPAQMQVCYSGRSSTGTFLGTIINHPSNSSEQTRGRLRETDRQLLFEVIVTEKAKQQKKIREEEKDMLRRYEDLDLKDKIMKIYAKGDVNTG